ncbi:MAG: hemolysin family protein [Desulfomonilia bacterium]|uniref:Magnesium and cobalt efflux protein CorC n=1 Tax=anaerobic digester metagenome TaxID=1263854 RepID=A0A485M2B4_9ZZZZ|nr:hemolysin family protein [Pseudomonadota bacterium]HON38951.1 hemolysin family protein [Deltaproteobacteria bacterium]HRS55966.1 hemolysin family protein [Desulfomonilia bacterium]HPD22139.1 hemolysin family protein [Deltaproteobacteria bacterium]HPX17871.1 hemolysin family protein [Deltaproteobacteria bacterium]
MESNEDSQDSLSYLKRLWLLMTGEKSSRDTKKEIEKILDEVEERGIIDEEQGDMIHNIIVLKDTLVREIMVPKSDMVALEVSTPLDKIIEVFAREGCSRIPIYEDNLDNIIGVVHAKDILKYWNKNERPRDIRPLLHPPYFVPEGKKLIDLLQEFRQKRPKMAIVIDEYGNVDGLLTMSDVVEEIIGDIVGEDEAAGEEEIVQEGEGLYSVDPRLSIDEFSEKFGVEIPEGNYDTIGGFITCRMERIPESGETMEYNGVLFEIAEADKKRISKLMVRPSAGTES